MNEVTLGRLAPGKGLPPLEDFLAAEREGWIWSRTLETSAGRYVLFNYTKEAQYKRVWTPVTRVARGLIINATTGEVVALPLEKFFNLGEQVSGEEVAVALPGPFEALVKMDGSLGIGYRADGRLRWATRGSFASEQSVIAEQLWEEHRAAERLFFTEFNHVTPLAEIIHPETRVVVRYSFAGLVLIAARNRFTGEDLSYDELRHIAERTGMRLVERLPSSDMDAILARAATLNDNEEGFVLRWPGHRVKIKGKEYLRLHKMLTNVTAADLAQCWLEDSRDNLLVGIPEEFVAEYETAFTAMDDSLVELLEQTEQVYRQAPVGGDKRQFATWISGCASELRPSLFARRSMESPDFAMKLARDTMAARLSVNGLADLLREVGADELADACRQFEQRVGQWLWDCSRSPEGRAPVGRMLARFPKSPRSVLAGALEALQPELVVARLREFIGRADQNSVCGHLSVEEVFANAASPESRMDQHLKWVFSLPLPLRNFLDRWRESGRRDTADSKARELLAASIVGDCAKEVEALLPSPPAGQLRVTPLLNPAVARLAAVWTAAPLGTGPRSTLNWARSWNGTAARALLNQAWSLHRNHVSTRYIENGKTLSLGVADAG